MNKSNSIQQTELSSLLKSNRTCHTHLASPGPSIGQHSEGAQKVSMNKFQEEVLFPAVRPS